MLIVKYVKFWSYFAQKLLSRFQPSHESWNSPKNWLVMVQKSCTILIWWKISHDLQGVSYMSGGWPAGISGCHQQLWIKWDSNLRKFCESWCPKNGMVSSPGPFSCCCCWGWPPRFGGIKLGHKLIFASPKTCDTVTPNICRSKKP